MMTAMPVTARSAAAAYGVAAVLDTVLAGSGSGARPARWVTKPGLMPLLWLAGRTHRGPRHAASARVEAAQALSWVGDVALLVRARPAFLSGVASFAAAHVAYTSAFVALRDPGTSRRDPGPRAVAAAWLAVAPALSVAAARTDRSLAAPVAGYSGVLATMVAASTTLDRRLPHRARRRIVAGTALFMASDALIGVQRFVRDEPWPALESAVMATYTAAQWLIADGVGRLPIHDLGPGRSRHAPAT